jgi:hypothetical protein
MTDFSEFARRDLRLTLLKSLSMQPGFSGNENILQHEAAAVGLHRAREVIRTELRFLESIGAVKVKEAGSVMIGILTARGQDHVKGLLVLDGVNTPSPE